MAKQQSKSYVSKPWGSIESTDIPYDQHQTGPIARYLTSVRRPGPTATIGSANSVPSGYTLEDLDSGRPQNVAAEASTVASPSRADETALAATLACLLEPVDLVPNGTRPRPLASAASPGDVGEYAEGIYVQAAALLAARRLAPAARLLQRLDAITGGRPDRSQWVRRTEFLWAVYAHQTADVASVLEHCTAAATGPHTLRRSECHPEAPAEPCLVGTIDAVIADQLPLLTARAHIGLGQPGQAEAVLTDRYGSRDQAEARQPAITAMLACYQGRLGDAMRLAIAALQAAERQDAATEVVDLEARLVLAEVFIERDQLGAAWRQVQAALRSYWLSGATPCMWAVELGLARVLVAQGRAGEAIHRLEHLRAEATGFLAQPLLQKLNQLSIECRLEFGDPEGALLIAKSMLAADIPAETLARLDLRSGRPDRAVARLSTSRSPSLAVEIRRLVLLACAEKQRGQTDRAYSTIRRAVEIARPEGFVRPFLERAAQTLPLLRDVAVSSSDSYLTDLIVEAERVAPAASTGNTAVVLEPLTERERQILHHLPSHLTLGQIGLSMFLSTNTVKTHVKAIYRKVGAISRADAVNIAREQGLLSSGVPPV